MSCASPFRHIPQLLSLIAIRRKVRLPGVPTSLDKKSVNVTKGEKFVKIFTLLQFGGFLRNDAFHACPAWAILALIWNSFLNETDPEVSFCYFCFNNQSNVNFLHCRLMTDWLTKWTLSAMILKRSGFHRIKSFQDNRYSEVWTDHRLPDSIIFAKVRVNFNFDEFFIESGWVNNGFK